MAREAKALCDRCEQRIRSASAYCRSCGYPTRFATHDERAEWELKQYRRKNSDSPLRESYDTRPNSPSPRPASMIAAASALAVVDEPIYRPLPAPASRSVAPVKMTRPAVRHEGSQADAAASMLAMRALNARVADLDAKVRLLEAELAEMRARSGRRFGR